METFALQTSHWLLKGSNEEEQEKEEGEEVIVKAPKGDIHYEVEAIEYK